MNIVAKCANTVLASGKAVIDDLLRLNECRGDRFFARVRKELREDTKNTVARSPSEN